jgi:hypothetical protein
VAYTFGFYTFYHGRAGAVTSGCQGLTPQTVPYVDVSFPMNLCPFDSPSRRPANAPDNFQGSACTADNDARWMDTVVGVVRRTETVPGAGGAPAVLATTDYTQYSFPYGEQGSTANKQTAQSLTVVLFPPDTDNLRRAKAVLFNASPKGQGVSISYYNEPGDRVGADLEERVFESDPTIVSIDLNGLLRRGSRSPFAPPARSGSFGAPTNTTIATRTAFRGARPAAKRETDG